MAEATKKKAPKAKTRKPRKKAETLPAESTAKERDPDYLRRYAMAAISTDYSAARVISAKGAAIRRPPDLDMNALRKVMQEQAEAVHAGDMSRVEDMLSSQATALQDIFSRLASKAIRTDSVEAFELAMRMALRAQNQCRTTLETLSKVKNPPVVFAKQANIAHGHQQVNNGTSHVREVENTPNKLLEQTHGERLEFGTTGTTAGVDPALEAVGAVHRAEDGGGQG